MSGNRPLSVLLPPSQPSFLCRALPRGPGRGQGHILVTLLPAMGLTEQEGPPTPGAGLAHPAVRCAARRWDSGSPGRGASGAVASGQKLCPIRGGPISLFGGQRKRIHTKQEEMERGRHRDRRSCHPRVRDGAWLGVVVWVPAPGEASPRVR